MRSAHLFRSTLASAVVALGLAGPMAQAEELNLAKPASSEAGRPARGMTMQRVESTFGAPASRVPAVGTPAISRWEYPGFVVFFENDHVIHTVAIG
jgi:hypothetical protein